MFKQSEEDKLYWDWFKSLREPCCVCGHKGAEAAHLKKRSQGGRDRDNCVYLCRDHIDWETDKIVRGCHSKQEGRTNAFIVEFGIDLLCIARTNTDKFDKQLGDIG